MLVKRGIRGNIFSTQLQFKSRLDLKSDEFYRFEFYYYLNYDSCNQSEVSLSIFLRDENLFKETLFDSSRNAETGNITRWIKYSDCFQVNEQSFILFISANSSCDQSDNGAFIAIDNIAIIQLDDQNLEEECKDFRNTASSLESTIETTEISQTTPTQTFSSTKKPLGILFINIKLNLFKEYSYL